MALRAVPDHPKFAAFKAEIGQPRGAALGWLEAVWHFTGRFTPQGNIGKYTDQAIEAWVEWNGPPGALVGALLQTGWLDRDRVHRLLVHDWEQHADKATKNALKRSELGFCTYTVPTPSVQQPNGEVKSGTLYPLPEPEPEPEPVPDPEAKKPSPKPRKKRVSEDGMVHSTNPRHIALKAAIEAYWKSKNTIPMPWDGSEGAQLGMWETANPQVTVEQVVGFLRNRFKSEVNHGDRPRKWIANLTSYANGSIDKFGNPLNGGTNGTGKNQPSAASERVRANRQVLADIAIKRGLYTPPGAFEPDGEPLPESGFEGRDARVRGGFTEAGPEILPPESRAGR